MYGNMEKSPQIPPLPEDVIIDIVARVPMIHYPTLSQISKSFRSLIASSDLYERRSFLGITQYRVYAVIRKNDDFSFYILHKKVNGSNGLVLVPSHPVMSSSGSYVSVGSKVYVFNDLDAFIIDCTSHTDLPIPKLPRHLLHKMVNVVDGKKIYLIGDTFFPVYDAFGRWLEWWTKAVTVFDTETHAWELLLLPVKEDMPLGAIWSDSVVMDGKVYMNGYSNDNSSVYEPNENKWEPMDVVMNSMEWEGACVVDDVLYYHDCSGKALRAYDPKDNLWRDVNGLKGFLAAETAQSKWCKAVNYGKKKLALFFPKEHDGKEVIYCAEIGLERHQGGEINSGEVVSCGVVVEDGLSEIVKCVSVTV